MKKIKPVITKCPVCEEDLIITELSCLSCDTKISGKFNFSKFNHLSLETLYFIEIFVKNRGNIKQVEKEMDISYPTVKKYLDEAITSLGYKVTPDEIDEEEEEKEVHAEATSGDFMYDILDKIKQGEIKVKEALEKIKKGNKDE